MHRTICPHPKSKRDVHEGFRVAVRSDFIQHCCGEVFIGVPQSAEGLFSTVWTPLCLNNENRRAARRPKYVPFGPSNLHGDRRAQMPTMHRIDWCMWTGKRSRRVSSVAACRTVTSQRVCMRRTYKTQVSLQTCRLERSGG